MYRGEWKGVGKREGKEEEMRKRRWWRAEDVMEGEVSGGHRHYTGRKPRWRVV